MEDPGGGEEYEVGGCTMPYFNDDIGQFKYEELFASQGQLLGRVTYEGFAAAWPTMTAPSIGEMASAVTSSVPSSRRVRPSR